jgi:hypothetical protein
MSGTASVAGFVLVLAAEGLHPAASAQKVAR